MLGCQGPSFFALFRACAGPSLEDTVEHELSNVHGGRACPWESSRDEMVETAEFWSACKSLSELSDVSTDALSESGSSDEASSNAEVIGGMVNELGVETGLREPCGVGHCNFAPGSCAIDFSTPPLLPLQELLHGALEAGRVMEARRHLFCLESAGTSLESLGCGHVEERLCRIASRFEQSLAGSNAGLRKGWISERSSKGFDFAFHVDAGRVTMVANIDFDDCDPLKAFVALREMDLCTAYKANVSIAKPVVEDHNAIDSLWMLKLTGQFSGAKEDSIVEVVAVDALDEPIKALWISMANPTLNGGTSLRGALLPPVEKGVNRIQGGCTTFQISPNQHSGGFHLSIEAQARIPAAAAKMPSFAMKMIVRRDMRDFSERLRHHIKGCTALQQRIEASPRTTFYQEVQKHLKTYVQNC